MTINPNVQMMPEWERCAPHDWQEIESQFSNEYRADVRCTKCKAPGGQDRQTGEVYWPAI